MQRHLKFRLAALLTVLLLTAGIATAGAQHTDKRGRKYKAPPATSRLEVTVLRDADAKPIENAAIVFHPMLNGKDEGNMELKSNEDGKAVIDVIPTGYSVRVQIIAKGFQTYGADYQVDKDQMALEVRMKRPGEQYSVYKPHEADEKDQKAKQSKSDENKGSDKPADSTKPN